MGISQIYSSLPVFLLFEVGLYLAFLSVIFYRKPIFWICTASFLLIPLYQVGLGQDFCMRVSIPALFALQLMIQKELLGREKEIRPSLTIHDRKLLAVILSVMLLIGTVVPVEEMSRSIWYTSSQGRTWSDTLKSLDNAGVSSTNFVGTTDGDFFYTYLARKD